MSYIKKPNTAGGIHLRALREACDKTQFDVELEAQLGIGYLQRLELGKVQYPERDTLDRILTALGANFMECREVLSAFGYVMPISIPNEAEIKWAIHQFETELQQDVMPMYLLDCSHRLLAWNALVPKLFQALNTNSKGVLMPKLIFDPVDGIAASILNKDTFFAAQIRILQYEHQRCVNESWYAAFVDDMRHYRLFDHYWSKQHGQSQVRPLVPLELDTKQGIIRFRLISESFVQDPRFRVIYYLPSDHVNI